MNLSKKQTLLVLGLTTLIFWSCTKEQVCDENTTSAVNFAILNKTTNSTIETRLYYIVNDDDATDTLFHSRKSDYKQFPLKISGGPTKVRFGIGSSSDEIIFYHKAAEPVFQGMGCGYSPKFKIDSMVFTKNIIDSIYLFNKSVFTDEKEINFAIYYH